MSPSRPFIERPVATSLLMLAILLAGIVAFKFLPLSALPEVDYPTIQVQTGYPGASPEVMATTVTAPLEVQFGQMTQLDRMSFDRVPAAHPRSTLQFDLSRCRWTSPNRRSRRRSTRRPACCRPICRPRRSTPRSIQPTHRC